MSSQRFAIIDPAAGVSGDMLLGALIDLGASRDWLEGLPHRLGLGDAQVTIRSVNRCGLRATKVDVRVGGASEGPGDVSDVEPTSPEAAPDQAPSHGHHRHPEGHHHPGHHGPHRHVGELLELVERAPVSPWVRGQARRAFELLAQAEGRVHGVSPERVALHEVGALDAVIDIVGTIEGFERLGVDRIFSRPVALGNGWVRAAHGVLPVPAPATSILAEGLTISPDGPVQGEATTPTGAALLRVLAEPGAPAVPWRAIGSGWGAGTRDPVGYPNAVKVVLGETQEQPEDLVAMVSDIDDLSPEYLEPLREALVGAGALDVQVWATQMKKGRVGFRVETLVPARAVETVADAWFRNSTTAGIRWWPVRRAVLAREQWELETAGQRVRIKTLLGPGGPRVKPEFDDVLALARRAGQPAHEISRRLQEEAARLVRPGTPRSAAENVYQKE